MRNNTSNEVNTQNRAMKMWVGTTHELNHAQVTWRYILAPCCLQRKYLHGADCFTFSQKWVRNSKKYHNNIF